MVAPVVIDDTVARNLVDPALQASGVLQAVSMLMDFEKHVLQEILSSGIISDPTTNELVQGRMKRLPCLLSRGTHHSFPFPDLCSERYDDEIAKRTRQQVPTLCSGGAPSRVRSRDTQLPILQSVESLARRLNGRSGETQSAGSTRLPSR